MQSDQAMLELRRIANTDLRDATAVRAEALVMEALLLHDTAHGESAALPLYPEQLDHLQMLYEKFETDLEYEFADKLLAGKAALEEYPLYVRFQRLVDAEAKLAAITTRSRVLFIGSGPFPISPILINSLIGAAVDCYDVSEQAYKVSRQVVDKLGLTSQITVKHQSGETGPVHDYDVIVIALLAQPKAAILSNIFQNGPENRQIILRDSEGIRTAFYKPADAAVLVQDSRYTVLAAHHAAEDDTISSFLLRATSQVKPEA